MKCEDCGKLIGSGAFANVYQSKTNKNIVIKVIRNIYFNENEYKFSKKAYKLKVGPKIYKKKKEGNYTLIYMQKADTILYKWLQKRHSKKEYKNAYNKITKLVEKLHENNIIHGDIHIGNIGLIKKRWVLLDYGITHNKNNNKSFLSYFFNIIKFPIKIPLYSNSGYKKYLKKIIVPYRDLPFTTKVYINYYYFYG
jgi:tRNA A-37 threonylcarbamoyl transferase component Bud32